MAKIKLKRVTNKNPQTKQEHTYVQTMAAGNYSGSDLVQNIARESQIADNNVEAVLKKLRQGMLDYLKAGNSVEVPGIGTFRIVVRSEAKADPKEATAATIKGVRLSLQPCKELRQMLANQQFELSGVTSTTDETQQEEEVVPGQTQDPGNQTQNPGNQTQQPGNQTQEPGNQTGGGTPSGGTVTVQWLDNFNQEKKSMEVAVGGSIQQSDIPAASGSNHWDKNLDQINAELASATAGSTITVKEQGDDF